MNTLGWVFILAAILFGRAVYKGRILNVGTDMSDAFLALVNNDSARLKEVLSREGDSNTPSFADMHIFEGALNSVAGPAIATAKGAGSLIDQLEKKANASVALASMLLGSKAKGYKWAASGPDYYDCSGLMWKAMQATKVYNGGRFNTATFPTMTKKVYKKVTGPAQIDDIVLWPIRSPYLTGHMGVVTGPNLFYSARSQQSGIGESKIDSFRHYAPTIYRQYAFKSPDA